MVRVNTYLGVLEYFLLCFWGTAGMVDLVELALVAAASLSAASYKASVAWNLSIISGVIEYSSCGKQKQLTLDTVC